MELAAGQVAIHNSQFTIMLTRNCLRFKFGFVGMLLMQCIGTLSPAYAVLIVYAVGTPTYFSTYSSRKVSKRMPFKGKTF